MTQITATAHTNIALIKYWGKLAGDLNIPATSSLSLTLDKLFTTTSVSFVDSPNDIFELNGVCQESLPKKRVENHINIFRTLLNRTERVHVRSKNHVITAGGLASSASGFAALTLALSKLFDYRSDPKELSTIARRGSGSAARSLFGGFVLLHGGSNKTGSEAFAEPLVSALEKNLCMLVVECSQKQKTVSSTQGMLRTQNTSVFFDAFLKSNQRLLDRALDALLGGDLSELGRCMEQSTLQMHATMLGCEDPFWYFNPKTIRIMQQVSELRSQGYGCYFTMDAGPHVKILCPQSEANKIAVYLQADIDSEITRCQSGPNAFIHN